MAAGVKLKVPEKAKAGEVIEIRALIEHPMESGFRVDNVGRAIPRHIINLFTCTYAGKEIFRVKLHPAVATNPYFAFHTVATISGELEFTWTDDRGKMVTEKARLEVS